MNFPPHQRGSRGTKPLGWLHRQSSLITLLLSEQLHPLMDLQLRVPAWLLAHRGIVDSPVSFILSLPASPGAGAENHPHSSIPLTKGTRSRKEWQQRGKELDCIN